VSRLVRVGDLEVTQDLAYERRSYRLRLTFAVVFALILLAGLLGVLGRSGPLSDTTAGTRGLTLGYERFARLKTPTELRIRLDAGNGATDIGISRGYYDDVRVRAFSVEPEESTTLPERVVLTFAQRPPSEVRIVVEPQRLGRHRGTLHGPGGRRVSFTQWVWP
jgi:hypothetical protein